MPKKSLLGNCIHVYTLYFKEYTDEPKNSFIKQSQGTQKSMSHGGGQGEDFLTYEIVLGQAQFLPWYCKESLKKKKEVII